MDLKFYTLQYNILLYLISTPPMALFSFEIIVLLCVTAVVMKLKKAKPELAFPQCKQGLVAYLAPKPEQIEMIRKNQRPG